MKVVSISCTVIPLYKSGMRSWKSGLKSKIRKSKTIFPQELMVQLGDAFLGKIFLSNYGQNLFINVFPSISGPLTRLSQQGRRPKTVEAAIRQAAWAKSI
jgi:hypothetical protein